jgi:hypothetical protein
LEPIGRRKPLRPAMSSSPSMSSMEEPAKSDRSLAYLKVIVDDHWEVTDF